MSRYTPLWSQIVDSSLWMEADRVVKMFMTMLALQDRGHVVRFTAWTLGWKCWGGCGYGWDQARCESEALKAIKVLEEPDKRRRDQPDEGRRIRKVEGGWFIINGEEYHRQMVEANARASKARWARKHRAKVDINKAIDAGAGREEDKWAE